MAYYESNNIKKTISISARATATESSGLIYASLSVYANGEAIISNTTVGLPANGTAATGNYTLTN